MRFLIDMNLSPLWVPFIEAGGLQAQHWRDVGALDAPDEELLGYAEQRGLVLITQDLDFGRLLAMGGATTPSVIQFRAQDVLPGDVGSAFLATIEAARDQIVAGALVTIDPKADRVTLLPITR
jgi:predicted nuclease of predicted toxin-antitoxin system